MDDGSGGATAAQRGARLLELGRPAEAETYLRQALAADPSNTQVMVHLARSLHQQDRFVEARDVAERALATSPEDVNALVVLSAALAGLEQFDAALDAVRRGLHVAPSFAGLHRQEGALLIAQERSEDALVPLQRARALDPLSSDTLSVLAVALINLRRFEEAEQAVADALRLDPLNAEAHRLRGVLSLRAGGGSSAVEAHRTALRLEPTEAEYREGLATAMKSRNPLYGLLLRYSTWVDGLPAVARWLVVLAPFIATRLLEPFGDALWARVALGVVIAVVVVMWTLEPLMNSVLLCSALGRHLLPRETKVATAAFLGFAGGALVALAVSFSADAPSAGILALGLGLWAVTAGQVHILSARRRRLALRLQAGGALLAAVAAVALVIGAPVGPPLTALVVLAGVAMIWFTAFA